MNDRRKPLTRQGAKPDHQRRGIAPRGARSVTFLLPWEVGVQWTMESSGPARWIARAAKSEEGEMTTSLRWTSTDLELLPDDGKRYEIIDGELYVSRMPTWAHQAVCTTIGYLLHGWSEETGLGSMGMTPGLVFAEDDDVAPDLVWASKRRLAEALGPDGHLHAPPELVVEVLSPGSSNERRDREVKLKLYSRRGVDEYWIADWRTRTVMVYRRAGAALELVATLGADELLVSPLLPGFSCLVAKLFTGVPEQASSGN